MFYNGYEVVQSSNNHIWIGKDGHFISHINCSEKKSDEELKEIVDFTLKLMEESKETFLNDDGSDDPD